eukprot:1372511-Rhodomonas_salina.1
METAEAQGGECIEYLVPSPLTLARSHAKAHQVPIPFADVDSAQMIEQFCNGNLLSDVQQRMAAGTLVADGAISCPQRIVKEVLPSMYAAW